MRANETGAQVKLLKKVFIFLAATSLYGILVFSLSRPLAAWFYSRSADEKGLISALRIEPKNSIYHYLLGRHYDSETMTYDSEKAILYYKNSLTINPLQSGAWIYLSKNYLASGRTTDAEFALDRAVQLTPNSPELMWEAGTFWLINNKTEKAVGSLKKYLILQPNRQNEVYDLCWKLNLGNSYIINNLLPDLYSHKVGYLKYLMATDRSEEAQETWDLLDKNSLDKHTFLSYIDFLTNKGSYEKAGTIWKEIFSKIEGKIPNMNSAIWNPNFEDEIWNGGFDWKVSEVSGADVFIDDVIRMNGSRSLGVAFDGKHNPDITIAQQLILVNPGTKYKFAVYLKTDSITTSNGVFWGVSGHNCSGLSKRSETFTGTNSWKEVAIDFDTPPACHAIVIYFKRERSDKFDNKIGGTAWIDGISLKQPKE